MTRPMPAPPPSRPGTWTDLQALAVAIQLTKSRGEAAALVATFRAPRRPPPAPEPAFGDDEREDPPATVRRNGRQLP